MTLTLLIAPALLAPAAQAQAVNPWDWITTDPAGNYAPYDYGPGYRMSGTTSGKATATGTYALIPADWWPAYVPNPYSSQYIYQSYLYQTDASGVPVPSALSGQIWLTTMAGNWTIDQNGSQQFYYNSARIGGGVSASAGGTLSNVWTYDPDPWEYYPDDPPPAPDHLDMLVTTALSVVADNRYDYGLFGPGLASTVTATNSLGDTVSADGAGAAQPPVTGRHLVRVPVVGGLAQVSVGGQITASVSNTLPSGASCSQATAYIFAHAQIDSREVTLTTSLDGLPANGTAAANADPTNRHLTGWASLNWKVQDDDSPSVPFYDGYANYFVSATGFTPTSYAWQTNPAPFVQSMATPDDLIWELPDYSVSEKHFHFDLGDDFTRFPQQTAVTGTATGADPYLGALSGSATATVTWHSPWEGAAGGSGDGGPLSLTPAAGADVTLGDGTVVSADTVTAGQTLLVGGQRYVVLTVQPNADGTLTFYLAPAQPPNPQDGDDIMALVAEYQARTQMAIAVGKVGLKLGFEMYDQLGQAYVMGPLTELTAPQLVELLGEAATVIGRGLEGSKAAEYYTALGSYGTSLLPGLAQKVAFLEAGVAAGTASEADLAAARQALEETQTCIAICDQAAADMGGTYAQYDGTGTEVQNAVLDAQDWQAETAAGKNCFAAGTPVWMADGTQKPIEQVKAGDVVLSRDPQTGVTAAKAVLRTFRHQADATVSLRFPGGDTLRCTAGHPFYVSGKGFVPAGMLALGSSIVTRAGPLLALSGSEHQSVPTTVYNFEVADFHTYFVGKSGLWVHNICEIPPGTIDGVNVQINQPGGLTITDLDIVQTDAQGQKWLIETKDTIGSFVNKGTGVQQQMSEEQKKDYIIDLIGSDLADSAKSDGTWEEGKMNKYLRVLQSGNITLDAASNIALADKLGTSDSATLTQMLKSGQIRIAFRGTASTMTQSMRFRIMRALRKWEIAHATELGGYPVGLSLP